MLFTDMKKSRDSSRFVTLPPDEVLIPQKPDRSEVVRFLFKKIKINAIPVRFPFSAVNGLYSDE